MEENSQDKTEAKDVDKVEFKKPVLIGRVGKLPKNIKKITDRPPEPKSAEISHIEAPKVDKGDSSSNAPSLPPALLVKELSTPIPYKEPKWSGLCPDGSQYGLEVLKSGMIVENIDVTKKPYYVFGRLANCDVVLAHPTISRHHCVLQYKAFAEENEPQCGWYIYDLGSTHGTFLNKDKLKQSHYTRVRVGHQIKLGASSRTYIVQGPEFDCEGESDLSVTEIKRKTLELKLNRGRLIQEAMEEEKRRKEEEERKREEQGIDWGMGEDADESVDLSENPYAVPSEELYLADPKKTLRGYFEREGHELTYHCDERGPGQFLCRVDLPLDDARGRPLVAEVLHRGKKKEAVVACALEACRVLERCGALRQATHESRRRKQRDWAADDFYDSDEDSFLDRTGAVESKRHRRMERHGRLPPALAPQSAAAAAAAAGRPLAYDDLTKQITEIETKICFEEKTLERLRASGGRGGASKGCAEEEDDLDAYMESLQQQGMSMATKAEISQTKMSISKLKRELARTQRLADAARPAQLPPLGDHKMAVKKAGNDVVYGKRIRLKEDAERQKRPRKEIKQEETEFVEELDSDEEDDVQNQKPPTQHERSPRDSLNTEPEHSCTSKRDSTITTPTETDSGRDIAKNENERVMRDSKSERDADVSKRDGDVSEKEAKPKRTFGPQRPPDDYVTPDSYFDQESDRDLPNIEEKYE